VSLEDARRVADAVLFEGYSLYPYRPSSRKNVSRWQFGVLAPRAFAEEDGGDPWWMETQCLLEPMGPARVHGELRFLRLRKRQILAPGPVSSALVGGRLLVSWDEGEEESVRFEAGACSEVSFDRPGDVAVEQVEGARVEWRRAPIAGGVRCALEPRLADRACIRLSVRVENRTAWARGRSRDEAMSASLLGAHLLLRVEGGRFVSLVDPPAWAERAARDCKNVRVFPVLAGDREAADVVLASPIILYDYPEVAPESPGDLFDATEIDEILLLRTRAMTEEEKREACAADPRVAALVQRADALSPASMDRLHGTFRALRADGHATATAPVGPRASDYRPGDRVRLLGGGRRTDAQDMFLVGMTATVRSVLRDVSGRLCLAVTLDEDPASELHLAHGRFRYFCADEVERVDDSTSS
jgi:hypothetical protein